MCQTARMATTICTSMTIAPSVIFGINLSQSSKLRWRRSRLAHDRLALRPFLNPAGGEADVPVLFFIFGYP